MMNNLPFQTSKNSWADAESANFYPIDNIEEPVLTIPTRREILRDALHDTGLR